MGCRPSPVSSPSPQQVDEAWERYPDAAGALIVSPSPYGTCADLTRIAEICHARGKPLIVDEAWGAHLPFHAGLPTWAMDAGADVCVVSVHKMGAGFEQGSVFHLQGDLVDEHRLSKCADLLMTTSPNVMVYAALDGWRRQMVERGRALFDGALALASEVRASIDDIEGVSVLDDELMGAEASTISTDSRCSSTYRALAHPGIRRPTGCASTVSSTSEWRIIAASWRRCPSPTTSTPLDSCSGPSSTCGQRSRTSR